jgi:regulator of sigma E protease
MKEVRMVEFLAFIVVFSLLVFVHELGHFTVAKLRGVRVEEFGFGYPPRMVKLGSWKGTIISLNWLPIGGFVRMGEEDPKVEGGLASKGRGTRALVYVSGPLMNVVLAFVLFSITFMIGTPTPYDGAGAGIYSVTPRSPAELAGLRPGDTIISLDGQTLQDAKEATAIIRAKLGQPIEIVRQRNGQVLPPVQATPRESPPPNEGALGVALDLPLRWQSYPLWQAVPMGLRATYHSVVGIVAALTAIVRGRLPFEVSGPVGIYRITAQVAKTGLMQLIEFTGMLSLNLFLFNLLPLPALDGGRLVFVLLEWVRGGRKVAPEKEGLVHLVGMAFLLLLMAVVTYFDVMRYLG